MNYDQLTKGQKMYDKILELKKFIRVLQNGYVNSIIGWDYSLKSDGEKISFSLDGELREIVIEYMKSQLKKLEEEFEKL